MIRTILGVIAPNATPANATPVTQQAEEKDLSRYLPLYKAALQGDWDTAKTFLHVDPNALTANITEFSETVVHVAAGTRKATQFLKNLLELIPPESLEILDFRGNTVLHSAAQFGNIEAAKILVARNQRLPNTWSKTTSLQSAAMYGHRELTMYLFTVIKKDVGRDPFAGEPGVSLLNALIYSKFYDMALQLVQRNPELGTLESSETMKPFANGTPLGIIAGQCSAFLSGTHYKPWQRFIYSCVPVKSENISAQPNVGDSENPYECCLMYTKNGAWATLLRGAHLIHACQKLHRMMWSIMELVPQIKKIKETKHMHSQTLELVKLLCNKMATLDHLTAASMFASPVLSAAKLGLCEVVEEILDSFPAANWSLDEDNHYIFHQAVIHRREKVFNLKYQLGEHSRHLMWHTDNEMNTILHLAGKLAPPQRINLVSGAALQMQRELQWYEEVKNWVPPQFEDIKNSKGKTPAVIFIEEHKSLVKEGERWMKDTANSCSVAAALIATIAFAAAITVPGGTAGDSGFPIFSKEATFIVFTFSNAISLFSSTAALLMFLSILTARYAEGDFLFSLPSRLIIGLITLFLSITSMMITFSATLYLVVGNKRAWALIAVAVSACLPVTLFVSLQFPLLVDMIRSTYRPRMFERKEGESGSRY